MADRALAGSMASKSRYRCVRTKVRIGARGVIDYRERWQGGAHGASLWEGLCGGVASRGGGGGRASLPTDYDGR
jgi:hypothetical protein